MVDPWARFYESSKELNDTLQKVPERENDAIKNQMMRMQLAQGTQEMQDQAATRQAFRASGGDIEKALPAIAATGDVKTYTALATQQKAQQKAQQDQALNAYKIQAQSANVIASADDANIFEVARQEVLKNAQLFGADPTPHLQRLQQMYSSGGSQGLRAEAQKQALTASEKMQEAHRQAQLNMTREGHEIQMRGQDLAHQDRQANLTGSAEALTPEAESMIAARYTTDGSLPSLGQGKAGTELRTKVLNKAGALATKTGLTGEELRIAQMGNKANLTALSKLQSQQTMVGAFERNFNMNADLALEQSKKVDNTGVPLANKWINVGKRAVTGDPELAKYDAVVKATVNEYAKIVSGSMGNTVLAEAEIKKVEDLLSSAQTPEQVEAVVKMMKLETQNRMKGFEDEKAVLVKSMKIPQAGAAKPPAGATYGGVNPSTGQMEYFDSTGRKL